MLLIDNACRVILESDPQQVIEKVNYRVRDCIEEQISLCNEQTVFVSCI